MRQLDGRRHAPATGTEPGQLSCKLRLIQINTPPERDR
jgi:hypothetical protein